MSLTSTCVHVIYNQPEESMQWSRRQSVDVSHPRTTAVHLIQSNIIIIIIVWRSWYLRQLNLIKLSPQDFTFTSATFFQAFVGRSRFRFNCTVIPSSSNTYYFVLLFWCYHVNYHPNIIEALKSRRLRCAGHLAKMKEDRTVLRVATNMPGIKKHWEDQGVAKQSWSL